MTVDLGNNHSFNVDFLKELAKNPNVTYVFNYNYNGKQDSDRIPAGTDYAAYIEKLNGNKWIGPEFRKANESFANSTTVNQYSNRVFYRPSDDLKDKADWNTGCFTCSVAMLLSTMGVENATPNDIWSTNGNKTSLDWDNVSNRYNLKHINGEDAFVGKGSNEIQKQIEELCRQYPQGIVIYGINKNNNYHAVYAFSDNGVLKIHDPLYTGKDAWRAREIGGEAETSFDGYGNLVGYHVFVRR